MFDGEDESARRLLPHSLDWAFATRRETHKLE
jgi:hypothetical protein